MLGTELGLALASFGEAVKALGQCEGGSLGKAFAELAKRSDILALKSQKQVSVGTGEGGWTGGS